MPFEHRIVSGKLWLALVTAASIATLTPVAQAQAPEPTTAAALAAQAARAQSEQRFAEAIDKYARAYQMSGDPNLLFLLSQCQRTAGRNGEALRTLQNYLRRDPQGVYRDIAEKQVRELESTADSGRGAGGAAVSPPPASVAAPAAPVAAPPVVLPSPSPPVSPPASVSPPAPVSPSAASVPVPSPTVDLRAEPAAVGVGGADLPVPRWVPWSLAAATVALGSVAVWSGLSANDHFDQLQQSCGQTPQGCDAAAIGELRSRARRTNILWALTGVAAMGTGVTVYVNTSAAGVSGLWRY